MQLKARMKNMTVKNHVPAQDHVAKLHVRAFNGKNINLKI